jgi:hypothetical protein
MDASHSLLDFLKAFESALEQRENDLQLAKYKQIHENVTFKTLSPLEYHASEILTNYNTRTVITIYKLFMRLLR